MDKFSKIDKDGQGKVIGILKNIFSNCTLDIEQHIEDKGRVDIIMTSTTPKGNEYKYAIECKDRYCSSTQYNDWMIEVDKYNTLKEYSEQGYKPIYFNTFSDNTFMVWNLDKAEINEGYQITPKTTVEDNGYINRLRYYLPSSECSCSGTFHYK